MMYSFYTALSALTTNHLRDFSSIPDVTFRAFTCANILILPRWVYYLFGSLAPRPGAELVERCCLTTIMEAPPPFFGYQIFAALDPLSSACNSEDAMTLPLHYRLVSSGDLF
ncbi:hypothetical protein BV22DRAFT_336612, partial [Leucogyrophana mollusca]